jgi:hypothetical protein
LEASYHPAQLHLSWSQDETEADEDSACGDGGVGIGGMREIRIGTIV